MEHYHLIDQSGTSYGFVKNGVEKSLPDRVALALKNVHQSISNTHQQPSTSQ